MPILKVMDLQVQGQTPTTSSRKFLPKAIYLASIVFCLGLFVTILGWSHLVARDARHVNHLVSLEAERLGEEVQETLHHHATAVHHIADRWNTRGRTPKAEWDRDVANHMTDLVGFKAINWVDSKLVLRWIAPIDGTRHLVGTRFDVDPVRREAIERARASHRASETPVLPLFLGGMGFIIVEPLNVDGRDDGFILGIFDIEKLLVSQSPRRGYNVVLTDERTRSTAVTGGIDDWRPAYVQTAHVNFNSQNWRLDVTPSAEVVSSNRGSTALFTLILGTLISSILSLLVFYLLVRRRMTQRLQAVLADVSLYKFALDKATMVAFKDANAKFTYVNDKFCELSGYGADELLGQHHSILDVHEDPTSSREDIRAALAEGRTWQGELSQRAKDGRIFWNDAILVPRLGEDGKAYQFISIRRDITIRKELEKQFERMVENLPAGAMLINSNGLFMNVTLEKLTGYSRAEIPSLDRWFELLFGDQAEMALDAYAENVASGFAKSSIVPARMKSGETRHLEFFGRRDGQSEIWVIHDVTEKVAAQERFELVFKHSVDGQLLMEPTAEGIRIIDANPAAVAMVGAKSKAELVGRSPLDFSPKFLRDTTRSEERFQEMKKQISFERIVHFEWDRARLDGTIFPVRVSISPVRVDGRVIFLSTWHDLTQEKLAQAKLVQSSKMVSLGEMAGGLAHELNTPLATIKAKVQQLDLLTERGRMSPEELRRGLAKVESTVDRISRIVGGLRSFSGEGDRDPMVTQSVSGIVDDALAFCETRLRDDDIDLRIHVPADLEISCRPWQVTQVVLNLLNNAFDAVTGRPQAWIEVRAIALGDKVEIRVADSGPGIPRDIRPKIMQPFFTTKEVGFGTGLGLSVAKGIIDSHSGSLELDETRANTCFVVRLTKRDPAATKTSAA